MSGAFQLTPHVGPAASLLTLGQPLLDAVSVGVHAYDAEGRVLAANRRAAELWTREPRLLDTVQSFLAGHGVESLDGDPVSSDETPMVRAAVHGERFEGIELRVLNPDGRRWVARIDATPLHAPAGELLGAVICFQDVTREHVLFQVADRQRRVFDLTMSASRMGAWRYTLADNICFYDENAQALYGLTDPRFLHDEAGVQAKIHPEDQGRMWERVAVALDPAGEGRYEVEYRVKQLDGAWRWVSAWGLVEFEGYGAARRPVAIAGASRDLTGEKQAG